jgi:hypothetical protein
LWRSLRDDDKRHAWPQIRRILAALASSPGFSTLVLAPKTPFSGLPPGEGFLIVVPPERLPEVQRWRDDVALELQRAGMWRQARALRECGDSDHYFLVEVCAEDRAHFARPVIETCHLPICPECQGRAQHRMLEKFLATARVAAVQNPTAYSQKHIVLTTPISRQRCLADPDLILRYFSLAMRTVRSATYAKMRDRGKLTDDERQRRRLVAGRHGIGAFGAFDFGERGHKLHFHIFYNGPFLGQADLSERWSKKTAGLCQVVYIRRVDDVEDSAREVIAKYAIKLSALMPGDVPAFLGMLRGVRRVRAWGIFVRPYRVIVRPPIPVCPECGSITLFIARGVFELVERRKLHSKQGNKSLASDGPDPPSLMPNPPPAAISVPLPGLESVLEDERQRYFYP